MQRLTVTHVRRWQQHRGCAGLGHVYQGRYKSFTVESDVHSWVDGERLPTTGQIGRKRSRSGLGWSRLTVRRDSRGRWETIRARRQKIRQLV